LAQIAKMQEDLKIAKQKGKLLKDKNKDLNDLSS
jgi:hypothetical protein